MASASPSHGFSVANGRVGAVTLNNHCGKLLGSTGRKPPAKILDRIGTLHPKMLRPLRQLIRVRHRCEKATELSLRIICRWGYRTVWTDEEGTSGKGYKKDSIDRSKFSMITGFVI